MLLSGRYCGSVGMARSIKAVWDYDKVEQLAAQGLTLAQIAAALGYGERTLHDHKVVDSQLSQSLQRGKAKGIAEISNALFQTALEGNTQAQIFYLKNRDPENWSDRQQLDALVAVELPTTLVINVTDTPRPMTKGCVIDQETDD